jgi:hypothetical protein
MSKLKAFAAAAAMVATLAASAASAGTLTQFGATTSENLSFNSTTDIFNITGGILPNLLLFQNLGNISGIAYSVNEEINNGAGVAVTSIVNSNGITALTLGAFTLSYDFATPTNIDGVNVTNLLTLTVGAGTVFDYVDATQTASWQFSIHGGNAVTFTSDLLRFVNVVDESVAFSFSDVSAVNNGLGGFDAQGSGNFSSNPLPQVPEPVSAALLVVGMTAVGVAARRRRAV